MTVYSRKDALYSSASHLKASRYLFVRSIRKLSSRFSPVLWEGEDKVSKLAPILASMDEALEESHGFLQEQVVKQRLTATSRFCLFEVGKVRTLRFPFVPGNDTVSTKRTSICLAFFGIVDVQNAPFFVASGGM